MSKILITGANGFIGSFLVEEALRQKHEVYAAVRSSSDLTYLKDPRIRILTIDLSSPDKLVQKWSELKKYMPGFDYVIHNAGVTQAVNSDDFDKVNNLYMQNLLQSFMNADFHPLKFILMSSLAANGPGNAQSLTPIQISDSPNPITNYGRSKLNAEQYLTSQQDLSYLIFRPSAVYGPREKDFLSFFKAINQHLEFYISKPKQRLSFIHVKDLAHLLIQSCSPAVTNKIFFVSDGNNYTCKEFASISKETLGKWTIPIIFPKYLVKIIANISEKIAKITRKTTVLNSDKYKELTSLNWSCNSNETQKVFDFVPKYDLKKGIEETIKWYRNNKYL